MPVLVLHCFATTKKTCSNLNAFFTTPRDLLQLDIAECHLKVTFFAFRSSGRKPPVVSAEHESIFLSNKWVPIITCITSDRWPRLSSLIVPVFCFGRSMFYFRGSYKSIAWTCLIASPQCIVKIQRFFFWCSVVP